MPTEIQPTLGFLGQKAIGQALEPLWLRTGCLGTALGWFRRVREAVLVTIPKNPNASDPNDHSANVAK